MWLMWAVVCKNNKWAWQYGRHRTQRNFRAFIIKVKTVSFYRQRSSDDRTDTIFLKSAITMIRVDSYSTAAYPLRGCESSLLCYFSFLLMQSRHTTERREKNVIEPLEWMQFPLTLNTVKIKFLCPSIDGIKGRHTLCVWAFDRWT